MYRRALRGWSMRGIGTFLVAASLFIACQPNQDPDPGGSTRTPPDPHKPEPTIDCGAVREWDSDGDGISNSIEVNNTREGYLEFDPRDCDEDPSRPQGQWYQGELEGGVNLTDQGSGYIHYRGTDASDSDDWGALKLIDCIETVGRAWEGSGVSINVNDLSLRTGGSFTPHRSHQNGLDMDIRYVRADGRNAPLDLRYDPEAYDLLATQELFRQLIRSCEVEIIFVDTDRLGFTNRDLDPEQDYLYYAPGHSNHFHVRLEP